MIAYRPTAPVLLSGGICRGGGFFPVGSYRSDGAGEIRAWQRERPVGFQSRVERQSGRMGAGRLGTFCPDRVRRFVLCGKVVGYGRLSAYGSGGQAGQEHEYMFFHRFKGFRWVKSLFWMQHTVVCKRFYPRYGSAGRETLEKALRFSQAGGQKAKPTRSAMDSKLAEMPFLRNA